jgi:DNA-binding SARP family transcriptional activator/tetratricopeptide (TPR) repeat protein
MPPEARPGSSHAPDPAGGWRTGPAVGGAGIRVNNVRMSDAAGFELQFLGPVRLLRGGLPLPLRTRKSMALLLLPALEGGMGRARLCAWLWPQQDESSARRNLRRELARIRDAGADGALLADGDHLHAAATLTCDLGRAEALVAQGRPDAALEVWRGDPAEDIEAEEADSEFARWLHAQRQRALALRCQALEASAALAEARGDLAAALARMQSLLRDDALQERHHRAVMRLLALDGQREAALRQYELCSRLLASELGLVPMPETQALARSLRADSLPAADAAEAAAPSAQAGAASAPAAPALATGLVQLPPQLPFVGRETEVARLQAAWVHRRAIVLVGEAGTGKTRLAVDFTAAQGPYALVACAAGDSELPLAAFTRALRVLAGQPPDLRALEPWVAAEMARLLPEWGPAPPPLRSRHERLRFDEACVRAWQALVGEAFDAIVLDDWQLADVASRVLLGRVAARRREKGGAGALEILAWRGAADEPELQATAEALAAETVELGPLPEAAVYVLVRQLSGAAAPARFAQRLRDATGGHPFFIAETLRDLAERALLRCDAAGRWHTPFDDQTQDYRELPLPASVREAVLARVRRLGMPATRLLEAAALAGEPLAAGWLASACALSEHEAVQVLGQAAQAQLVVAREGGGYAWAHDLARMALDSALEPTRRRLVHHQLALAAEAMGARMDAARHFEACGEPARAAPHRLAAGDAAYALHALAEAAAQWRQGLADQPAPGDEAALLARLSDVEWLRGQPDEARALHERLTVLLDGPGLDGDARTDLQLRAAQFLSGCGRLAEAMQLLEAMPPPEPAPLRLRWWLGRMGALHRSGRLDEALADGLRALALAPAGSRQRAEVLASLSTIEHSRGQMRAAVGHADACLALFTRLGDAVGRARGLFYRGAFSVEQGDHVRGEADLREAATLAARHGNVYLQRLALYNLASVFSNLTRPAEALAVAHEAWSTLAETPGEDMALMFRAMFIECYHVCGDWGPMWAHLDAAVGPVLAGAQPLLLMGLANSALEPAAALGQWPRVLPLVQALDQRLFDAVPVAAEVMLGCAQAALIAGDLPAVASWLARVPAVQAMESPRVHARAAVLRAALGLAGGAGPEALHGLPADDAPGMNPELRLRALTLRCQADAEADSSLRMQALEALQDPAAHAGAALMLARTLGGAVFSVHRQRLANTLADWPEVQRSFLATWH